MKDRRVREAESRTLPKARELSGGRLEIAFYTRIAGCCCYTEEQRIPSVFILER